MYNYVNKKTGKVASLIADDVYEIIIEVVSPFQLFILILSIVFFFIGKTISDICNLER